MTTCSCRNVYGFDCQFSGEPASFRLGISNTWCRFHLPLRDSEGNESNKWRRTEGWEQNGEEWEAFKLRLISQLATASTPTGREADCRYVAFPHGFNFRELGQPLNVDFKGASFGYQTFFDTQRFGTVADFSHANFWGAVSFINTTFECKADFYGAKFRDIADFKGSNFTGVAEFSDARFEGSAHFDGATFGSSANFIDAILEQKAGFDGATFGGVTLFDDSKLGDRTSFSGAKFQGEATFSVRDVDKVNPKFQRINFSQASFFGPCSFENRKFTANASFNDAEFHDLAKFHGCTFHQGMSFHGTKFLKSKGDSKDKDELNKQTGRLEQAYRTLKLGMETLRARNEEAYFFAKEMECRRNRGDVPRFERLAATLYKHLSDYGQAVDLPLLWLLVLADVAFLAFGVVALVTKIPEPVPLLAFTFEQMLRPFGAWTKDSIGLKLCLFKQGDLLIPILASLQSLATIALLALFLLALRRRFKMD